MKKQERQLFKALCSFQAENFDESLLQYATPYVLGQLFFNRMQGIAYGNLKKHGLLGCISREFKNSLRDSYMQNLEKNRSYFWSVHYLNELLSEYECNYAMLKGAYLCKYYPDGYRTSNDIDLLVSPSDVTKIGKILSEDGFLQGNIRDGIFKPAQRKEIIESKMMRGETVPYIKRINLTGMEFLEVDVNFSLNYKMEDSLVSEKMLCRAHNRQIEGLNIRTLDEPDFFIHLCCHLYKEATTLPWVEMKRDMTMYKYSDIYLLLCNLKEDEISEIFSRAKALEMQKICAFAIIQTSELFDWNNEYALCRAKEILKSDPDFIHRVISPKDKKFYVYSEKSVLKRFFNEKRKTLLTEDTKQ